MNSGDAVDTVQAGQFNVEDCNIRSQFSDLPDGVVPVRRLAHDPDVLLDFQQHLQTVQKDDAAVGQEHSDRHSVLAQFGSSLRGVGSISLPKFDSSSVGNP